VNHIGDTNKMVSDTPRTDAAIGNSQDRSWMDGTLCRQLERELNAANERTKRLEEAGDALMEIVEGARSERWNVNGFRLKDTPEWVQIYVSFRKAKRSKWKEAKP
jgi:hypothetical protein